MKNYHSTIYMSGHFLELDLNDNGKILAMSNSRKTQNILRLNVGDALFDAIWLIDLKNLLLKLNTHPDEEPFMGNPVRSYFETQQTYLWQLCGRISSATAERRFSGHLMRLYYKPTCTRLGTKKNKANSSKAYNYRVSAPLRGPTPKK